MNIVSLHRPILLLLVPVGLLTISAALAISVALQTLNLVLLIAGFGLATATLWVIHRWAGTSFEIYGSWTYNGRMFQPVLVQHHGVFNCTERNVALTGLVEVTINRPLLWSWCDGAIIILHFMDQETLELGLVDNAGPAVELLRSALQLNQRHFWPQP